MKKVILSLFLLLSSINCYAISEDTKIILEQMDKRFEQVDKRFEQIDKRLDLMQHNMDKRFEQVDKRFEQVDKRFDQTNRQFETVFNILYILMGLIFASPFIAIYLRDKKDVEDRKNFEIVKGLLYTLRELAQDDEKIAKSMRAASLL